MILSKENAKAVLYLSKFSKLQRLILENSREKMVSLANEMDAIENYMALQNLEMENSFTFTTNIKGEINTNRFNIPPMLIQPFIENAIEHAFDKNQVSKEISITISHFNKNLICTIVDNGVGILAKKTEQSKGKKSLATLITSDRLKLLSKDYGSTGSVQIEDRKVYKEKGTIVTLNIPYIYTS